MDKKSKFVCRVCLIRFSPSLMRSLADQQTRELLYECTSVWVEPGDKYPQKLCTKCWNLCQTWSDFKVLAQDSDRQLRLDEEDEEDGHKESVTGEMLLVDCDEETEEHSLATVEEEKEDKTAMKDPLTADAENNRNEKSKTSTRKRTAGSEMKEMAYKCGYCPKTVRDAYDLRRHERVHTNERPFSCDQCDKMFKSIANLNQHKYVHSQIKAFECDQCHGKFKRMQDLKHHLLIHRTNRLLGVTKD